MKWAPTCNNGGIMCICVAPSHVRSCALAAPARCTAYHVCMSLDDDDHGESMMTSVRSRGGVVGLAWLLRRKTSRKQALSARNRGSPGGPEVQRKRGTAVRATGETTRRRGTKRRRRRRGTQARGGENAPRNGVFVAGLLVVLREGMLVSLELLMLGGGRTEHQA